MIVGYTGLPGACKTTLMAMKCEALLKRNQALLKATGKTRLLRTNMPFTPLIVKKYGHLIAPFEDIYEMPKWENCDIVITEVSVYFDAQEWEKTPKEIKRFLKIHRHRGVDIWFETQDFETVDKSFRRLVAHLFYIQRLFGTREPSPFKKDPWYPWVLTVLQEVDRKTFDLPKEHYSFIPLTRSYELFTNSDFKIFDTHADLPPQPLAPLRKQVREFEGDEETKPFKQIRYI